MKTDSTDLLDGLIVEQMHDALIYCDQHGSIRRWNRGAVEVFGYQPNEALGHTLDLIIPEHLRMAHGHGFDAAMVSGSLRLEGRPTLTRGLHKIGSKLYVEMSFSLVRDAAGHVLGSVAIARDVTARVEGERPLRKRPPDQAM